MRKRFQFRTLFLAIYSVEAAIVSLPELYHDTMAPRSPASRDLNPKPKTQNLKHKTPQP